MTENPEKEDTCAKIMAQVKEIIIFFILYYKWINSVIYCISSINYVNLRK